MTLYSPSRTQRVKDALADIWTKAQQILRTSYQRNKLIGLVVGLLFGGFAVVFVVACVVALVIGVLRGIAYVAGRAAGRLNCFYQAFMHRHVDNVGLVAGLLVVVGVSYGLYLLDPNTPTLSLATIQVVVAAPALLFVVLNSTVYTYKHLLPNQFREFVGELGNKLNQVVLPPLEEILPKHYLDHDRFNSSVVLAAAQFKLKYHLLKFVIRCVRFILFGLPFYFIFSASLGLLKFVLSMQPH